MSTDDCIDAIVVSMAKVNKAMFDNDKMIDFVDMFARRVKLRKEKDIRMARNVRDLTIKLENACKRLDSMAAAMKQYGSLENHIDAMATEMQEREIIARKKWAFSNK